MEQIISKEEINELINLEGEARGAGMKSYGAFILKEEGEEGLNKLESLMKNLGYPIKYREIKTLSFYPMGKESLTLLAIKKLFNYDENKFREMGAFEVTYSLLIKIFMKYFVSIERAARELPKIWKQHFTVGDFQATYFDKEKKQLILKLEEFKLHPLQCIVLMGVLEAAIGMIVKGHVYCEETKCVFRGDKYHEFLIKW